MDGYLDIFGKFVLPVITKGFAKKGLDLKALDAFLSDEQNGMFLQSLLAQAYLDGLCSGRSHNALLRQQYTSQPSEN